jgi:uncharacterized protein
MKKISLSTVFVLLAIAVVHAQSTSTGNPYPKTITVSGSAEMEIIPDEIYVNVELREYQKKGDPKKDIETIKSQFLASCKEAGIPDSNISIVSFSGFNNYYRMKKKKRQPDMLAGITYQVKFKTSNAMDALIDKLDDEATHDFEIATTTHSKMPEFRKQLKILAVKAAKDKGIYLTEAIGEKLGDAVTVNEPDGPNYTPAYRSNNYNVTANVISQARASTPSDNSVDITFKKIKLRYEVTVIFALQ